MTTIPAADLRPDTRYYVQGQTYPYRATLTEMGGTWDAAGKRWLVHMASTPKTFAHERAAIVRMDGITVTEA